MKALARSLNVRIWLGSQQISTRDGSLCSLHWLQPRIAKLPVEMRWTFGKWWTERGVCTNELSVISSGLGSAFHDASMKKRIIIVTNPNTTPKEATHLSSSQRSPPLLWENWWHSDSTSNVELEVVGFFFDGGHGDGKKGRPGVLYCSLWRIVSTDSRWYPYRLVRSCGMPSSSNSFLVVMMSR